MSDDPRGAAEGASLGPVKLSIVIPVFNEEASIQEVVGMVLSAWLPPHVTRELVCVNDCSSDSTARKLEELAALHPQAQIQIIHKKKNQGKGAALRDGFAQATGDIVIVQDGDLEYDPADYARLLAPILEGKADVVYGSRFAGQPHRVLHFWHYLANKMLTALSNLFNNLYLTDMEVCYKVFRKPVLDRIRLRSNRFGFEPEVTAKLARLRPRLRIYEVGITYHGRSYQEGKKITWKDALAAVVAIIRFRFFD